MLELKKTCCDVTSLHFCHFDNQIAFSASKFWKREHVMGVWWGLKKKLTDTTAASFDIGNAVFIGIVGQKKF